MQPNELISIGLALGYAQGQWWNDCWLELANAPRPLFERCEGFTAKSSNQTCHVLAQTIKDWLAEQNIVLKDNPWDLSANYGPSPWTCSI